MSFHPHPSMIPGMPPMGLPFMGVPPGIPPGMPPTGLMSVPPPSTNQLPTMIQPRFPTGPPPHFQGPPPSTRPGDPNQRYGDRGDRGHGDVKTVISARPQLNLFSSDHPTPNQPPAGPPVTVFVGNITEKWPDPMIRQLLATCGQVFNWKRVQGASGKLQGFGFCEFNGPDAGLRAVRLLHDIEVADKRLVVKVDAKTSTVLDEFKAERKKKKLENGKGENEDGQTKNDEGKEGPDGTDTAAKEKDEGEESVDDYMDDEMRELDERSRKRIESIFREFKDELEAYEPATRPEKPERDHEKKQKMQDKLHLLKLTSLERLDAPTNDSDPPEEAMEEGKREIISQEINRFREHMKIEKEREENRKRIGRERREREREREEREEKRKRQDRSRSPLDKRRDKNHDRSNSPSRTSSPSPRKRRSRSPSRSNENSRRDRDRDRFRRSRERDGNKGRDRDRNRGNRDRDRDRGNRRRSRDRSPVARDRDRSPLQILNKPRYREREEEEELMEQKRMDRKIKEVEALYDSRRLVWEAREQKKAREYKKDREYKRREEDDQERAGRRMKQFLEDYDDEKLDHKYYKGKELQKRLGERARELEEDNLDRQAEREELEEIRLRMLTGVGTPTGSFGSTGTQPYDRMMSSFKNDRKRQVAPPGASVNNRLLALAGQLPIQKRSLNLNIRPFESPGNGPAQQSDRNTPRKGEQEVIEIPSTPPRQGSSQLRKPDTPGQMLTPQESNSPVQFGSGTSKPVISNTPTPPNEFGSSSKAGLTSFNSVQFSSFVPIQGSPNKSRSVGSASNTPDFYNTSPGPRSGGESSGLPEMSPSIKSLAGTGFQLTIQNSNPLNSQSSKMKQDDEDSRSRHSYSPGPGPSPSMASPPDHYGRDDDSSHGSPEPKKKKLDVKDIFNQDEDDDGLGSARKRKLVPLDYGEESKKIKKDDKSIEDKKKNIKSLIDSIPTEKEALFEYEIDWGMVDNMLMERRIRPWINKKIVEYIGEPEPTLVDFICSKVLAQSAPQSILDDVMMVLDEEAEVFVVKMWRLLVYEIEAKKIGLAGATKP